LLPGERTMNIAAAIAPIAAETSMTLRMAFSGFAAATLGLTESSVLGLSTIASGGAGAPPAAFVV
jgi:hypothetical protein